MPPLVMIEVHELPLPLPLQPGATGVDGIHWPVLNKIVKQVVNSLKDQGLLQVPLFRVAALMEAGPAPVVEAPFETIVREVVDTLRDEGLAQAGQGDPHLLQPGAGGVRPLPTVNDFCQRVVDSLRLRGQQGTAPFIQGNFL
jgi:hypothetical protein